MFRPSSIGVLSLLAAAILWGAIGPISKFVFTQGITPLETAFWRGSIAGVCYGVHLVVAGLVNSKQSTYKLHTPHIWGILLFGIFAVALLEGSYVFAVDFGGASLASVLLYSAPVWVNIFAWIFFKEAIVKTQWLALTLTSLGIAGVSLWGSHTSINFAAIFFGLCSGFSYALFYLAGKKLFSKTNPVTVYAIAFPIASLALLPVIFLYSGLTPSDIFWKFAQLGVWGILPLMSIGIFSTYIPYILHGIGLNKIAPGKAAIITSLEPVVSIVLSHLIWAESFSFVGYICAGIVILGIALGAK